MCDGVSELVREQEAVYLSTLEQVEVLDPALTRLVPDRSPGFADSLLYMESQLRTTVPNDGGIHVGHEAAMDLVPYQLDPARQTFARPRQRILIADAVGLGKTLEAGILVSELIARGRARRILVLAVKSMLTQFQKEFAQLLDALGYGYEPQSHLLEGGDEVPMLFAGRQHGSVALLILGAYYGAAGEDEDPLDLKPHPAQYHGDPNRSRQLLIERVEYGAAWA